MNERQDFFALSVAAMVARPAVVAGVAGRLGGPPWRAGPIYHSRHVLPRRQEIAGQPYMYGKGSANFSVPSPR